MEEHPLIEQGYIPFDKSWIIRMVVLDLLDSREDTASFLAPLAKKRELSDDVEASYVAYKQWKAGFRHICVGESGTLYRFLKFASWALGLEKEFMLEGTLIERAEEMHSNPEIINWHPEKLLTLDNRTSQYASVSYLMGLTDKIENPPYKLQVSYDAVEHWKQKRAKGEMWEPRYDKTLEAQAEAYLELLKTGKIIFEPEQAEDYCFARAFNLATKEEGEFKWPSLRGHETDRIEEMENALKEYHAGRIIESTDHRIVQAIAMLMKKENKELGIEEVKARFKNPLAVNKSWPQFWKFLFKYNL